MGVSSRLLLPVSGGAVNSESAGFEEDCRLWAVPLASRCRTSAAPNSQGRGQLREDMGEFSASFTTHTQHCLRNATWAVANCVPRHGTSLRITRNDEL